MSDAVLTGPARDRLTKLLGMLGSAHAGERATAGLKANQLIRGAGMTWDAIMEPIIIEREVKPKRPTNWREPESLGECIALIQHYDPHLNDWEQEFIKDMQGRHHCSPKQAHIIERLVDRARGVAHRPPDYEGV